MTSSAHSATPMLSRLREIPRHPGDYTHSASEAKADFGIDAAWLQALRQAGLSGASDDDEPLYAPHDLHYLGLRLGVAREVLWAVNLWRRSLDRVLQTPETVVHFSYLPQLADEGKAIRGRVLLPEWQYRQVDLRNAQAAAELRTVQRSRWPDLPDDVVPLLDEVAAFDFCLLPPRLCGDIALARKIRMTECSTSADLIVEGCHRLGRDARVVQGLIIGLPFSSLHTWAEMNLDGTWTPVDPVMIEVMRRFAHLDPAAWPHHRSLGPLLTRVAVSPSPVALVSSGEKSIPTTFLTRIVAE